MRSIIKIFFFLISISPFCVKSQCDSLNHYLYGDNKNIKEIGRFIVEEQPTFPGGDSAKNAFLKTTIKALITKTPDSTYGKVFLTFLIDEKGNIKYPCVLRGFSPILDSIAIATIRKMPKWIPAKQRGNPVSLPFNFIIDFGSIMK